ncbi:MAG: radical SAM protein, partial [Candidatus Moranbacteria bacterium]|nr:radical SAM protein [Candidatus Moranbacteria bacterium]
MNISDSERIAGFLENNDYTPSDGIKEADLAVFNTCGVRQMAEDRVYGQIHNLKKNNPEIKIALTGCLANRKDVQRRLKNKVDLFFPINDFKLFENFVIENCLKIENFDKKNTTITKENADYLSIQPKFTNSYQAFVPIMTGCNNFCSYCVVPYARGREVSRPAEDIITEINTLVGKGYKEITLLGQIVNSYSDDKINFSKLLKKVNALPGKFWIRFVSNHPKDVTDEMIGTVAK